MSAPVDYWHWQLNAWNLGASQLESGTGSLKVRHPLPSNFQSAKGPQLEPIHLLLSVSVSSSGDILV